MELSDVVGGLGTGFWVSAADRQGLDAGELIGPVLGGNLTHNARGIFHGADLRK
jgi:hypothetical protein